MYLCVNPRDSVVIPLRSANKRGRVSDPAIAAMHGSHLKAPGSARHTGDIYRHFTRLLTRSGHASCHPTIIS